MPEGAKYAPGKVLIDYLSKRNLKIFQDFTIGKFKDSGQSGPVSRLIRVIDNIVLTAPSVTISRVVEKLFEAWQNLLETTNDNTWDKKKGSKKEEESMLAFYRLVIKELSQALLATKGSFLKADLRIILDYLQGGQDYFSSGEVAAADLSNFYQSTIGQLITAIAEQLVLAED